MPPIDELLERAARALAQRTSRRGLFARVGGLVVGAAAVPLLPVARGAAADDSDPKAGERESPAASPRVPVPDDALLEGPVGDPASCEYWRHCAIDGFLCSCCGGSHNACPPGTEMAAITWIGTCRNPGDGRDYIISYNDCCGKSWCGRCICNRNEGEKPVYLAPKNNDINWCSGATSTAYHCSVAIVLGVAAESRE